MCAIQKSWEGKMKYVINWIEKLVLQTPKLETKFIFSQISVGNSIVSVCC
jgi:hypothetical protein